MTWVSADWIDHTSEKLLECAHVSLPFSAVTMSCIGFILTDVDARQLLVESPLQLELFCHSGLVPICHQNQLQF
jgi:hypothetical protein